MVSSFIVQFRRAVYTREIPTMISEVPLLLHPWTPNLGQFCCWGFHSIVDFRVFKAALLSISIQHYSFASHLRSAPNNLCSQHSTSVPGLPKNFPLFWSPFLSQVDSHPWHTVYFPFCAKKVLPTTVCCFFIRLTFALKFTLAVTWSEVCPPFLPDKAQRKAFRLTNEPLSSYDLQSVTHPPTIALLSNFQHY